MKEIVVLSYSTSNFFTSLFTHILFHLIFSATETGAYFHSFKAKYVF